MGRANTVSESSDTINRLPSVGDGIARAKRRLRVLLIDDEPLILRNLKRALHSDHDVVTATGGELGLEVLQTQDFDAILCDLMMPKVDGCHVYEALRKRRPHLLEKLAYLSGGVFTDRMFNFLDEIRPHILSKPAHRSTLLRAIEVLALPTSRGS